MSFQKIHVAVHPRTGVWTGVMGTEETALRAVAKADGLDIIELDLVPSDISKECVEALKVAQVVLDKCINDKVGLSALGMVSRVLKRIDDSK